MEDRRQGRMPPDTAWPETGLEAVSSCPVCGASDRSVLHTKLTDRVFFCAPGTWTMYRCHGCGSAYLDPRPTPETLHLAYRSYYTHAKPAVEPVVDSIPLWKFRLALRNGFLNAKYGYELRPSSKLGRLVGLALPLQAAREARYVRHLPRPKHDPPRLLDVGCGNGWFLARMRSIGWDAEGLEPDPQAIAAAKESGLVVHQGTLTNTSLPDNYFDAITMGHVIEHLHDPLADLRACFQILRPGGILWIATPNVGAPGHRLFGGDWRGLEPPRHLVLFTRSSLARAVKHVGFVPSTDRLITAVAQDYFRPSAAIAQRVDPNDPPRLTGSLLWRARIANLWTSMLPSSTEEIVLLARKPVE